MKRTALLLSLSSAVLAVSIPLAAAEKPVGTVPARSAPAATPSAPVAVAPAEAVKAPEAAAGPAAAPRKEAAPPRRDPTEPDASFAAAAAPAPAAKTRAAPPPPPTLPAIALKAIVIVKDRPGKALIEIDRQLYQVAEKDRLSVPRGSGGKVVFSVTAITREHVCIEAIELRETVVLR